MNIVDYSVKNRLVIRYFTILTVLIGIFSYMKLGKLEDPEFKIKEALIITYYPGASPHEVELQVTDKIETALRQIPNIQYLESVSKAGYSEVKINLQEFLSTGEIEQYWDNVRRKVNDVQKYLPQNIIPSVVLDDYGDVYGMFFAMTSEGYSEEELNNYVSYAKREFQNIRGVSKVSVYGKKNEAVEIVVDREKLAGLNLNDKMILAALISQNMVANGSSIDHGELSIRVDIDSAFKSKEDIENLVIYSLQNPKGGTETILLKDIASVNKTLVTPIQTKMRHNQKNAIGLLLSPEVGTNVVETGKEIDRKLQQFKSVLPAGIEMEKVYYQPDLVSDAINQFVYNLIASVVVVVGVLLIFMGVRSGLIIGSGLILSILGTLAIMLIFNIDMQRVSLGAFIIAMGMLVDNSIVAVDGILTSLEKGEPRFQAMTEPVKKVAVPLLGATVIAAAAFLPIYLMPTNAGEYIGSLFWVVAISLMLSWVLSLTQTPVYCDIYLPENYHEKKASPRAERFYGGFKKFLEKVLKFRKISLAVLAGAFVASFLLFLQIPRTFFPDSDKKGFVVNIWLPQSTRIEITESVAGKLEERLLKDKQVINVTSAIGGSPTRYYIATTPEMPDSSFAQLIISVKDLASVNRVGESILNFAQENYPEAQVGIRKYPNGVPSKYPVEVRFSGPDPQVLRELSEEAMEVMRKSQYPFNIRNDWRNKVPTWSPEYSQVSGRKNLIATGDMAAAIRRAGNGTLVGGFRENDEILPILMREKTGGQNVDVDSLGQLPLWGLGKLSSVPLNEIIEGEEIKWENPQIWRHDSIRAIKIQCDIPLGVSADVVRDEIKSGIESIKLPEGYRMEWAGEYYEQSKNIKAVLGYVPIQMAIMFTICVLLFSSFKEPLIIFGILPMALIGIAPGLLLTGKSFGFMSIIGTVSLSGMMIKNGIVLLDQINYEIKVLKKEAYEAVVDSAANRIRPVGLAAVTTIFGMFPLIPDPLFGDMAVTIVFGLTVATVLTLFGVPLFYSVAYKLKK